MKRQLAVVLRVSAMLCVLVPSAVAFGGDGPPKPGSSPKKCSVSAVGEGTEGAAGGAVVLAIGLGLAARRRGRR